MCAGQTLPRNIFCAMEEKVRQYVEQFHMLRAGDSVVAGLSGGADSVCMLLLLFGLAEEIGFSLTAVHVEHGIRGEESLRDADFSGQLCRGLGIPFKLYSVDVPTHRQKTGQSPEEAARELRYDCYLKACEQTGSNRIALAHSADDCAETMLFNMARGTGIRGLAGIRPVSARDGDWEGISIVRPLLSVTRAEIEEWLAARGQSYCTDATNADLAYSRNRIRERVMPELAQINPQAVSHMQNLSGQLSDICDYLEEAAWDAGRDVFYIGGDPDGDDGSDRIVISCRAFLAIHPVLQKQLLLQLISLAAGSRKDITSGHLDQTLGLMTAQVGAKTSLPGGITAQKTYDEVVLGTENGEAAPLIGQDLVVPGETVTEDGITFSTKIIDFTEFSEKIPQKSYTKWFDYDKIKSAVRVRSRRAGDYFQTDADGGHKKLNRYFIDEKVPLPERDRIILLADGDHIMWAVGYRISEAYKVTEQTGRVLCVTVSRKVTDGGENSDG